VIVLYSKTYIFNFLDLTLIDCIDTCENPDGLCELVYHKVDESTNMTSMVSLDLEKGSVRMRRLQDKTNEYVVPCHMESISAMKLSDSGEYLATCCHDGLFIRVWGWKVTPGGNEEQEPRPLYMIDT
jgi:hypothetical protein